VSRPARTAIATTSRERLRQASHRAAPLREIYPQLAEVRVEFEFQDGSSRTPSPQAFSYFPAAHGFFRYACPCHSCSGEFDLSDHVAELAGKVGKSPRNQSVNIPCPGERVAEMQARIPCPITAQVRVSAIAHRPE
jgi:hypothetical protein